MPSSHIRIGNHNPKVNISNQRHAPTDNICKVNFSLPFLFHSIYLDVHAAVRKSKKETCVNSKCTDIPSRPLSKFTLAVVLFRGALCRRMYSRVIRNQRQK